MSMTEYALARAGDPEALALLIRRHAPLVQRLAQRFSDREDAFQGGCAGLVQAIRGFREERGFQFSTYAVPVILGEMRRFLPRHLGWRSQRKLRLARQYRDQILKETGREPSVSQMAAIVGLAPEELAMLLENEKPLYADEHDALLSNLPDPQGEAWLLKFLLSDALRRLPGEEGWLLSERFYKGRTQKELGRILKIDPSGVSRRERAACRHFRAAWLEE